MKKILKFAIAALALAAALVSCSKMSEYAYYTFDLSYKTSSSADNITAIEQALGNRHQTEYLTESEAKKEWNAFLSAVDDDAVNITLDGSYYTVSLVLKDIEGDNFVTRKTLASATWDKDGRHVK